MRSRTRWILYLAITTVAMMISIASLNAQETRPSATVPVRMIVTASIGDDKRMPEISKEDVVVRQGKERLHVLDWAPAQGDRAGLELFILIDDASDIVLGSHLDDVRAFISAQAPTTSVGVGYMGNATVEIVQNFTTDHAAAAKALRLPRASAGAYGSPYLSVIDLMKRWPAHPNRREVVMLTDGIDRARRMSRWPGLDINPDVETAGNLAMRTGTIIHTIYVPGVGRLHRNYWEATNGQLGIAKLSDVSGGESFFLGLQNPVSLAPYLDQLQKILENQYWLSFSAKLGKKAGLQYVSLRTEVAGVEFAAADAVWVPAAK